MKYFILSITLLFTTACSLKTPFLEPDTFLQKTLTYTKKGEIYNSLEIKDTIFATYLNPLGKNISNDDEFVVSIFVDDDFDDDKKAGLHNSDISLTLNGYKPIMIKELKKDDTLRKLVPFKNEWSHYYLVKFPKTNSAKKELVLESKLYGATSLNF